MPKVKTTENNPLVPFWTTSDKETVKLYHGNVIEVLKKMPAQSVHCCVTSPPYYSLRAYGTDPQVWGGDVNCTHVFSEYTSSGKSGGPSAIQKSNEGSWHGGGTCGTCGAWRGELGSEPTPELFIQHLVLVFREVRRVLHDSGLLFVNLGDSYCSLETSDIKPKDLVGAPWMLAFALRADGWYLRSDMPWCKRNPMPEPTTDRPSKALEYVFMLAKSQKYFFDMQAARKPHSRDWSDENSGSLKSGGTYTLDAAIPSGHIRQEKPVQFNPAGRNFRSADLWFESINGPHGLTGVGDELVGLDVTSESYDGAHFATFPRKLITPLIKVGSSQHGCCAKCLAPWERLTDVTVIRQGGALTGKSVHPELCGHTRQSRATLAVSTVGWQPTCECHGHFEKRKGTRLGYGSSHSHEGDGVAYGLRQEGKGPGDPSRPKTVELQTTIVEYVPHEIYRLRDDAPDAILDELRSLKLI